MPNYMFQQRPQTFDNLEVVTAWLDQIARNPQFGTWTPTISFVTPGDLNAVYSTQIGHWFQLGMMVFLQFVIVTSTFTHSTATGNLRVLGNPFTPLNFGTSSVIGMSASEFGGITKANYTQATWRATENSTILNLAMSGSAQTISIVTAADMPTLGSVVLRGLLIFPTALQ